MEGTLKVSYVVMCDSDTDKAIRLSDLLNNEKIQKAIKSEYAKGLRNISVSSDDEADIFIKTTKEVYEFEAKKDDFADLLELAEENARKNKRLKKGCEGVGLVDLVSVD